MVRYSKILWGMLFCVHAAMHGAGMSQKEADERAFRLAANNGEVKRVERFLAQGINPNAVGSTGQTALTLAGQFFIKNTSHDNPTYNMFGEDIDYTTVPKAMELRDVFRLILAAGGNIKDLENLAAKTPGRSKALREVINEIKAVGIKNLQKPEKQELTKEEKERELRVAVGNQNYGKVKQLLAEGVDPNGKGLDGGTTLMIIGRIVGDPTKFKTHNAMGAREMAYDLVDAGARIEDLERALASYPESHALKQLVQDVRERKEGESKQRALPTAFLNALKLDDERTLRAAITAFDYTKAKALLAKGVDPNAKGASNENALTLVGKEYVKLSEKGMSENTEPFGLSMMGEALVDAGANIQDLEVLAKKHPESKHLASFIHRLKTRQQEKEKEEALGAMRLLPVVAGGPKPLPKEPEPWLPMNAVVQTGAEKAAAMGRPFVSYNGPIPSAPPVIENDPRYTRYDGPSSMSSSAQRTPSQQSSQYSSQGDFKSRPAPAQSTVYSSSNDFPRSGVLVAPPGGPVASGGQMYSAPRASQPTPQQRPPSRMMQRPSMQQQQQPRGQQSSSPEMADVLDFFSKPASK